MKDHVTESIQHNMARFLSYIHRQLGFSQKTLAERADLHRNTIAQIERAQKDMSVLTLTKLFVALKMGTLYIDNPQGKVHCDNKPVFTKCPPQIIIHKQIACGVNFLRQAFNFSRTKVQNNTGIHRNTIARIENLSHEVRFSTLALLYFFLESIK